MSDPNQIDVSAVVQSAIGEKPWSVQKAFNDVMLQRVSDVIAGKRDEVARSYGIEPDDIDLEADPTEQELEDILADLDDEDLEVEDEELEEPEEEPEEDLGSEEEVEEVIDDDEEDTDGEKS